MLVSKELAEMLTNKKPISMSKLENLNRAYELISEIEELKANIAATKVNIAHYEAVLDDLTCKLNGYRVEFETKINEFTNLMREES